MKQFSCVQFGRKGGSGQCADLAQDSAFLSSPNQDIPIHFFAPSQILHLNGLAYLMNNLGLEDCPFFDDGLCVTNCLQFATSSVL